MGRYAFTLESGESYLFKNGNIQPKFILEKELQKTCKTWVKDSEQGEYAEIDLCDYTQDLCLEKSYENFAGKIKYQVRFSLEKRIDDLALDFGRVIGGLKVWVNRKEYPEMFGVPYVLPIGDSVRVGENELIFELSTTLVLKYKDRLSRFGKIAEYRLPSLIKLMQGEKNES